MEHTTALPLGLKMGEYKILSVLGHGGFGITYLAIDKNLNKYVAIKEYFPNDIVVRGSYYEVLPKTSVDAEDYQWGLQQFLNEAKTLATFDHPNIVKVFRFFCMNKTAYFVMEYTPGRSLEEAIKEIEDEHETIYEEDVKQLLFPLLDALNVIHGKSCYHRDIKPANIYIRDDNSKPILLDFGAARFSLGQHSKSISAIVTIGYAPVEQYQSSMKNQGPWTDIYGLAATMYRLVTGITPTCAFTRYSSIAEGQQDSLPSIYQASNGNFSQPFLNTLMYGLNIKKDQRPQSALEWKSTFSSTRPPQPPPQPPEDEKGNFSPPPNPDSNPLDVSEKHFSVYDHPVFGYKAVKKGFSWAMFFAGLLIPLILMIILGIKKMWWHVAGVFGAIMVSAFTGEEIVIYITGIIISFIYGFVGNEWYASLLKRKGYKLLGTVNAPNPETAISIAVKNKI